VIEKLPLLALASLDSILTLRAQEGLVMTLERFPFHVRLANAVITYWRYLAKMAWPINLAFYYPHPGDTLPAALTAGTALGLVVVTIVVLRARAGQPYLLVGWLWYVGTLVPVIGLIQVATQAMADRYTYIPLIGIFLMLVWGSARVAQRWHFERPAAIAAGIALLLCTLLSWAQTHYWANSRALWEHTLDVTGEDNWMAHTGLGAALLNAWDLEGAERELADAIRLRPDYADAYYNLGLVAMRRQNWAESVRCFETALRYKPTDIRAVKFVAQALLSAGETEKAFAYYPQANEADPDDPAHCYGLGRCCERRGQLAEAETYFRRAIALAPVESLYHRELGQVLHELGRAEESRAEYQESLRLDHDWPQTASRQAWTLATHPSANRRNGLEALHLARAAFQASERPNAELLDVLAAAYAEVGSWDAAVDTAKAAAEVAESSAQPDLARRIRARRAAYVQHQPFRAPANSPSLDH
jgi:tetratricopeptide (TPR) repeat protein